MYDWGSRDARSSGIALLFIAAIFLVIPSDDPPPKESLVSAKGQLRYLEKVRPNKSSGLRFGLTTDSHDFNYGSKEGAVHLVEESLKHAAKAEVEVLYDANESRSPWFDERRFHTVYELRVGNRTVRSYDEVLSSWRRDNAIGPWVSYPAAASGVFLLFMHFRKRRGA